MKQGRHRSEYRFFHPYRVRYSEIDGQGVVYNAHYLTFFDVSIHEYFRALNDVAPKFYPILSSFPGSGLP